MQYRHHTHGRVHLQTCLSIFRSVFSYTTYGNATVFLTINVILLVLLTTD